MADFRFLRTHFFLVHPVDFGQNEKNWFCFESSFFSGNFDMGGQGFFTSFVATLWDFYGGMFRLTLFLPFTLLQVEVIMRNGGEILLFTTYSDAKCRHGSLQDRNS